MTLPANAQARLNWDDDAIKIESHGGTVSLSPAIAVTLAATIMLDVAQKAPELFRPQLSIDEIEELEQLALELVYGLGKPGRAYLGGVVDASSSCNCGADAMTVLHEPDGGAEDVCVPCGRRRVDRITGAPVSDHELAARGADMVADAMRAVGAATFGDLMEMAKARGTRTLTELVAQVAAERDGTSK